MTTPHRTLLQQALDALDAITDDVDGTGLNTMPSFDKAIDAITALREAMASPEPEPVALESVHLTRDTRGMCVVRVNGRLAIRDNGDIIDHMATLEWFAAPPAAPADDHATPSGGQEAGPQEDRIEAAYWRFDARHKGYSQWKTAPMSERDAFKAEMRNALEAEKVRAEMRLVARGWRRPDAPAAPDHLRDVAEKAAPAVPLQGGMDNNELLAAWQKKLPGRVPEGQELNAFAVGTEVGFEHAQRLERMDWDRVHHALAKHGKHPGRTDDHLADVIDKALSAAPAVREPLTDEQIRSMWLSSEFRGNGGQVDWFCEGIRAAEAHHGITGGGNG